MLHHSTDMVGHCNVVLFIESGQFQCAFPLGYNFQNTGRTGYENEQTTVT